MTLTLAIACGAAETTGALLAGGGIVRFFFAPARGDESLPRAPEAGDIVLARIKTAAPALGGAFADIGADADAFLPASRSEKAPAEGVSLVLGVRRPALGGKGAVLQADWKQGLSPQRSAALAASAGLPRLLSQSFDPAFMIARRAAAFGVEAIVVNRPEAQRALAAEGIAADCDEARLADIDLEDALSEALEPVIPLGGGARVILAETAGGAVIDVDAGAAANAARKPNDVVNERAAQRLFADLSRRAIGGRVIVDFLPPSSPARRQALVKMLDAGAGFYERRLGKLAPDGLLDLTAPRRDLSLLERASEEAGEGFVRAGRRLTLDWTAKRAIAAVEARLARHPRLTLALGAGAALARYLEEKPQWLTRLAERYGARVQVSAADGPARNFHVRER